MPLTALQKARLVKKDPNFLGVYMLMRKFEQEQTERVQRMETEYAQCIKDLEEQFNKALQAMQVEVSNTLAKIREIQKGDKPVAGVDYHIPEDGHTPTREELIVLIEPLIPKIKDGHTPTASELLTLIEPLIPASIDENALVQKVLAQLPATPTADTIADLVLEKLKEKKIPMEIIEGLQNTLNVLNRNIVELKSRKLKAGGGGGGMGNIQTDNFTGNGSTTAFTLTARVASSGKAILVLLNGQVQEITTHYTISNKTLTFTTAPFDGAAIHVWYIRT